MPYTTPDPTRAAAMTMGEGAMMCGSRDGSRNEEEKEGKEGDLSDIDEAAVCIYLRAPSAHARTASSTTPEAVRPAGAAACYTRHGACPGRCGPRVLSILGAMSVDVRPRGRIGRIVSSEWSSSQCAVRAWRGCGGSPAEVDTLAGKHASPTGH